MSSTGRNESFASLFEQSASSRGVQARHRVGQEVEVTIVAIGHDAVFADLGGKQEGIFEKPELCDAEGKLQVEVGSKVSAVVRGIDGGTGQAKLQPAVIRRPDADIGVARTTGAGGAGGASGPMLVSGARVKGKVTGIERYGVFVQINGTSGRSGRGLVPSVETGTPRGADLKKHFTVGQEVEAKILHIDETGKIRLSVTALGADEERKDFEAYRAQGEGSAAGGEGEAGASGGGAGAGAGAGGAKAGGAGQNKPRKPEVRGFGTLGDLLPKVAPKPVEAKPSARAVAAVKGAPAAKGGPAVKGEAPKGSGPKAPAGNIERGKGSAADRGRSGR